MYCYSPHMYKPILDKVSSKDRMSLLNATKPTRNPDRTVFVTTFHPLMPKVQDIHDQNSDILLKSDRMAKILPSKPLVALKRTNNLGNILIKTKSKNENVPSSSVNLPPGTNFCGSSRCQICQFHLLTGPKIKSTTTSVTFHIRDHIDCNSKNIIYVITCSLCNAQYTGQTCNSLRTRFNNHKSAIRRTNTSESVSSHFKLPGHSISHLKIQGVEKVSNVSELNSAESRWIWSLKTHRITGGLNIDEPYLRSLTISN